LLGEEEEEEKEQEEEEEKKRRRRRRLYGQISIPTTSCKIKYI
jgi:hypothetical protein